jgi:hypothetical protein
MAFASVTTKVDTGIMTRRIIQTLTGGAGTGDAIDLEMLPYGAAHLVLTSGTGITNITFNVAVDGILGVQAVPVLKNSLQIGVPFTTFPIVFPLTMGIQFATSAAYQADLSGKNTLLCPYRFCQFVTAGGDATTVFTITIELMGSRG